MTVDPETFRQFCDAIDRFVRERLIPREREIASLDQPPQDLLDEIADLGLFGLAYPEEWGGLGLCPSQEMEIGLLLGRCAPAMRNMISIHNGVAGQGIVRFGTDAQKQRYLPDLTSGRRLAVFMMTEPDVGSDAASVKTRAIRTGDGWTLDGQKRFISNAPMAGLFTVLARTPGRDGAADQLNAFLIEADHPGLSIGKPEQKMGQSGAPICDVTLENVELDDAALLGGREGQGLKIALGALDGGRLFIAACCAGLALRLVEAATEYAATRVQFGVPIAQHQLVQAMLADCLTEAYAMRAMVREAGRKADTGARFTAEASMCKYFATEALGRIADRAVQIHGGNGYIADSLVEQLYRDVRALRLYEGTSQIQQLVIAKQLLARQTSGGPVI